MCLSNRMAVEIRRQHSFDAGRGGPRMAARVTMTPELQLALKRHTQWFGSYKKSGELKKIQVWLVVKSGQIEFLTPDSSFK